MADSLTHEVALPSPAPQDRTITVTTRPKDYDPLEDVFDDSGDAGDIKSTTATPGEGHKVASLERTEIIYNPHAKKPALNGAFPNMRQPNFKKLFDDEDGGQQCQAEDADEDESTPPGPGRITLCASLEDELYDCRLLGLPGLVEHLFPDSLFPIPFETLKLAAMTKHWDRERKQWKDPDIASATFFNDLSRTIIGAAMNQPYFELPAERIWHSECYMPPYGAPPNSKRTPGLNLVDRRKGPATWSSSLVTVERKSKTSQSPEALIQLTNGAGFIFPKQEERRFHIGISICGNDVRVYVFDRAGIVGSTPFHLKKNPELLIRLMAGLVLTEDFVVGLDSSIKRAQVGDTPYYHRTVTVSGRTYRLIRAIHVSGDLTGRGTVAWLARRQNVDYVIKDTWVRFSVRGSDRCWTEGDLLRDVAGMEGVPSIVDEEVVALPDGRPDDTSHLRTFIRKVKDYDEKEVYENLDNLSHVRIVVTPFAQPLKSFKSKRELLTVFIDAIEAHRRLVEKKIMHSDISVGNVMIHRPSTKRSESASNESKISESPTSATLPKPSEPLRARGLLIDLDNSFITYDHDGNYTPQAIVSARFTGTLPYASTEVLMGLPPDEIRQAHHDLESFFYVFLWITLCYAGPNCNKRTDIDIEQTAPFRFWIEGGNRGDMAEIGDYKYATMTTTRAHFRKIITGRCTPYFNDLIPCIEELWLKFFPKESVISGQEKEDAESPPQDFKPKVTHQEMIDILRKPLEWLPEIDYPVLKPEEVGPEEVHLPSLKRKDTLPERSVLPSLKKKDAIPERVVRPSLKRKNLVNEGDEEKLDEVGSPQAKRARTVAIGV